MSNSVCNILPYDGEVLYYPTVVSQQQSDRWYQLLKKTIPWEAEHVVMFGRRLQLKRAVAWYALTNRSYTYAGQTKQALIMTPPLLELKHMVEQLSQATFNSCLLNWYHNGTEAMGWHRDNERELVADGVIASISFGESRIFRFKHIKTTDIYSITLESGSVLIMRGAVHESWRHELRKAPSQENGRINITFRQLVE